MSISRPNTYATMPSIELTLDKTTANVDEIVTATLSINGFPDFSGYEVNLRYDPNVLQPVKLNASGTYVPFTNTTLPYQGTLLQNEDYSPARVKSHNINDGILHFGASYIDLDTYREYGPVETSGSLAVVLFKVISYNCTNIYFEASSSMPNYINGICIFDSYGNNISQGYSILQPPTINLNAPACTINTSPTSLSSATTQNAATTSLFSTTTQNAATTYLTPDPNGCILKGYINPNYGSAAGFRITVDLLDPSTNYAVTDSNGYFCLGSLPKNHTYLLYASKVGYLKRQMFFETKDRIGYHYEVIALSNGSNPVQLKCGDANGDGAVNMSDIMEIAKCFNTVRGDPKYNEVYDYDKDTGINMTDIMIVAQAFGMYRYPVWDAFPFITTHSLGIQSKPLNYVLQYDITSRTPIQNACNTWNSSGVSTLVNLSSATHNRDTSGNNPIALLNGVNEITKGERGSNEYVAGQYSINKRTINGLSCIIESDIDINTSFPFGDATINEDVCDVESILLHELGHAIGLSDLYENKNLVMNGIGGKGYVRRSLQTGDISGIWYIYIGTL